MKTTQEEWGDPCIGSAAWQHVEELGGDLGGHVGHEGLQLFILYLFASRVRHNHFSLGGKAFPATGYASTQGVTSSEVCLFLSLAVL